MSFEQCLRSLADEVEAALDGTLQDHAAGTPDRLLAAMRHGLLAGGKRLRPALVMMSARLFDIESAESVRTAAAIECVHSYSLIHDDLPAMDNDSLRRGQPTVHVAFDEATAILAGDTLLTLAFEILADQRTHPDAAIRARLALELAESAGGRGMAGGQMLDLQAETNVPDEAGILRLQRMKTGALLRYACRAGALLAKDDGDALASLTTFGEAIGAAFQIADDILDVESTSDALGKATGKDSAAGKATLVGLHGIAQARTRLAELVQTANSALAGFGSEADMLREAAQFIMTRQR